MAIHAIYTLINRKKIIETSWSETVSSWCSAWPADLRWVCFHFDAVPYIPWTLNKDPWSWSKGNLLSITSARVEQKACSAQRFVRLLDACLRFVTSWMCVRLSQKDGQGRSFGVEAMNRCVLSADMGAVTLLALEELLQRVKIKIGPLLFSLVPFLFRLPKFVHWRLKHKIPAVFRE